MSPGFRFPSGVRYWIPLADDPVAASRSGHSYQVIGRLRGGVTIEQAWADLDAVARGLEAEYPQNQ